MKTVYLVMKLETRLEIMGCKASLPDGEYVIPVFDSLRKAEDHACNGKYEICKCDVEESK